MPRRPTLRFSLFTCGLNTAFLADKDLGKAKIIFDLQSMLFNLSGLTRQAKNGDFGRNLMLRALVGNNDRCSLPGNRRTRES